MRLVRALLLLFSAIYLCSCTTIINRTTQEVSIRTTPPNAKLTIDGKKFGTTPQVVNIDRGSEHTVKLDLAGYEPYEIQVTPRLSPWVWLNFLNGFIPGYTIDYLSGASDELFPDKIDVTLTLVPVVEPPPVKKK